MKVIVWTGLLFSTILGIVWCDTPANCLYEDFIGSWTFSESERLGDTSINCTDITSSTYEKIFTFTFPNKVVDELGNYGTWTLIYNQGFEVNINERSYFAFFYYEGNYTSSISYCDQTFNGWTRDRTVRNWSCFKAQKTTPIDPRPSSRVFPVLENKLYKNDFVMIDKINRLQNSWNARPYKEWEKYTQLEMFRRAGGPKGMLVPHPKAAPPSEELKSRVALLPDSFDWRNVSGVNYISPIRDQQSCGSCYAFASTANLEANLRIITQNQRQDIFSPQDMNDCTYLAQGCDGGFDYLIAGRYTMEQGAVAESCNKYYGFPRECITDQSCRRTYVSEYVHVGGYYGACNEEAMLETLVTKGPISVSYEVYDDFFAYSGGIYHHTETRNAFNPFEITNHVVLIVGYGADASTGEKYWIVKNSWGEYFGEKGYFKIRRGTDECSIESMAVTVSIIP